jgi:hypothetical protein
MLSRASWIFRVGLVLISWSTAPAAELTFYCPFDGSVDARAAAGQASAAYRNLRFTAGVHGQALDVPDAEHAICFDEPGNLPKDRGSVELWVKGDWGGDDRASNALVWEDAAWNPGDASLSLWKWGQSIRFDIREAQGHYIAASITRWKPRAWHHLVATYDCDWGTRLYVDGRPAAQLRFSWTPRRYRAFWVGSRHDGQDPARAVIDELKIYNAPLSAAEVASAYRGQLTTARAKPIEAGPAARPQREPAQLTFHLPLDGALRAALARGGAEPLGSASLQCLAWTRAVAGKAARFLPGSCLAYAAAGNLRKDRGTIAFWFCPDFQPDAHTQQSFFRADGPDDAGRNVMRLWMWGPNVRFGMHEPAGQGEPYNMHGAAATYLMHNVASWRPGEWHFLAATWDARRGYNLYVDGLPALAHYAFATTSSSCAQGADPGGPLWETQEADRFFVGGNGKGETAGGAIDDVKIYDRPLGAAELAAEYVRHFPVEPAVTHRYFAEAKKAPFSWQLRNLSDQEVRGALRWEVLDEHPSRLAAGGPLDVILPARQERALAAEIVPPAAGMIRLRCQWSGQGASASYERTVECWAIRPEPARATGPLQTRLLERIDCTQTLGSDRYVDDGQSRVAASPAGAYREAGAKRHSRFAYRIKTAEVGQPLLLEWDYPDDRARTMDVVLQTNPLEPDMYDLQTGVFCGGEYSTSGKMLTHKAIVWPRAVDQALVFMTAENDRPAAVSQIRIYRIQGRLPALPLHDAAPQQGWQRASGLYYEDPVLGLNFGGQLAMPGFAQTIDRLLDYMDSFGQNILMYPGVRYRGPYYPSRSQPQVDADEGRAHPPNYIEYLCRRMGARGMYFVPTLNVHSLPALAADAVDDEGEIRAGRETALMMMWNNRPKTSGWHGTPPNFNPLGGEAQAQFTRLVDEMLALYGDLPAFKGICFHLTQHSILWFGTLEAGYNDCNVERFEAETAVRIPVDRRDPLRFNKRYRWLMQSAREAWIDWRCRAIHDYYASLARRMAARRPDLRLILNLYVPSSPDEKIAIFKSAAREEVFREVTRRAGVDIRLFENEPNIVVQRTLFPADYRWARTRRGLDEDTPISRQVNYIDGGFAALRACRQAAFNQHDRYWEDDIGRREPLAGLWGGETPWRVSTLVPNPHHCMELYAWALASADAQLFTKGGFVVGTIGMEGPLGQFTQALRALPAVKFADVPGLSDPVAVRQFSGDKRLYFYAVNRLSCPVQLHLRLAGGAARIVNLRPERATSPLPAAGDGAISLTLAPYDLESFTAEGPGLRVSGGEARAADSFVQELKGRLAELQRRAASRPAGDPRAPGFAAYFAEARRLAEQSHWGQLQHLLEDGHAAALGELP